MKNRLSDFDNWHDGVVRPALSDDTGQPEPDPRAPAVMTLPDAISLRGLPDRAIAAPTPRQTMPIPENLNGLAEPDQTA